MLSTGEKNCSDILSLVFDGERQADICNWTVLPFQGLSSYDVLVITMISSKQQQQKRNTSLRMPHIILFPYRVLKTFPEVAYLDPPPPEKDVKLFRAVV